MAQVLIRDLDNETLTRLKKRAEVNNRSLQRELRLILSRAAAASASESGTKRLRKVAQRGRTRNAPTGSVWNWLKRPAGKLSKDDVDNYIRAERESWESE